MKLKILSLSLILASGLVFVANAQGLPESIISSQISAFRSYKEINNLSIKAPTVVEVPFTDEYIERFDFAVLDTTLNSFEPHSFKQETLLNEIPVSVSATPNTSSVQMMIDKDTKTFADFLLPEDIQGQVQITLTSSRPITSSILTLLLDNNVALPVSVQIRALVSGQNRIVVAAQKMDQQTIRFPQTTSNSWQVIFTYSQPLRISELRLNQDNATKSSTRNIRFLAQQDHSYRIYFDPDRPVSITVGESGNLASAQDVFVISSPAFQNNSDYVIADQDGDGLPDISDNCVLISNPDQQDVNNNGRGDVCDDFDQDGVINSRDNCLNNPNLNQKDTDSDGVGDVCDDEESRITERYPWIPWIGIGIAVVVLVVLLVLTARSNPTKPE